LQSSESQQNLSVMQMIEQLQAYMKLKSSKKECKGFGKELKLQVEKIQKWIDSADVNSLGTLRQDFDKFKHTEFRLAQESIDNAN